MSISHPYLSGLPYQVEHHISSNIESLKSGSNPADARFCGSLFFQSAYSSNILPTSVTITDPLPSRWLQILRIRISRLLPTSMVTPYLFSNLEFGFTSELQQKNFEVSHLLAGEHKLIIILSVQTTSDDSKLSDMVHIRHVSLKS